MCYTMIQSTNLIGGGHDIAQYNQDGQRVRGICEAYDDYWMSVLIDLLTEHELAQVEAEFEPAYEALAAEPVTSQYADSCEAAGVPA